jgi:Ca2+-binding RTX toxin-like protein
MDYHGTPNDDILNMQTLGLPDGTNIFGGAGNDTISIGGGNAVGDAGNDTLIGLKSYSTAAYWTSPAGIKVNLATGIVQDGFGGTDTLQNIFTLQDSRFDDEFLGSAADETFWLSGGNDRVTGGGGSDKVIFYDVKSTDVSISYSAAADTFSVQKHLPNGDRGITTLTGVASIAFIGAASDNFTFTRDMFDGSKGFIRDKTIAAPLFDAG